MKRTSFFTAVLLFLFIFGSIETKLAAQRPRHIPDFSNPVLNTNCCPIEKRRIDSIMNNAPIVFEGRMIRSTGGVFANYYLFEVEKVYRGGERLQAGTVEIVSKIPDDGSAASFGGGWHIIFAKEIEGTGAYDANNSVKLEVFYCDYFGVTSHFAEVSGWLIPREAPYYSGFGMSINFNVKEELLNFIGSYGLSPTDIPKANRLKTLTRREISEGKQEIDDAEYDLRQKENKKRVYRTILEDVWKLDSASGKKSNRQDIEDAMQEYENAPDSVRDEIWIEQWNKMRKQKDSIRNTGKGQHKSGNANLTVSIKNIRNTEVAGQRFLEFDVMVRADNLLCYCEKRKI